MTDSDIHRLFNMASNMMLKYRTQQYSTREDGVFHGVRPGLYNESPFVVRGIRGIELRELTQKNEIWRSTTELALRKEDLMCAVVTVRLL
jgi:hypothetical protein